MSNCPSVKAVDRMKKIRLCFCGYITSGSRFRGTKYMRIYANPDPEHHIRSPACGNIPTWSAVMQEPIRSPLEQAPFLFQPIKQRFWREIITRFHIHEYAENVLSNTQELRCCTVRKVGDFPIPSRDVTNQTLPGRELFPATQNLVGDIPAGDGKIANLFLQCSHASHSRFWVIVHIIIKERSANIIYIIYNYLNWTMVNKLNRFPVLFDSSPSGGATVPFENAFFIPTALSATFLISCSDRVICPLSVLSLSSDDSRWPAVSQSAPASVWVELCRVQVWGCSWLGPAKALFDKSFFQRKNLFLP